MTDGEVIEAVAAEGFELEERPVAGEWRWGFVRQGDDRYPAFLERRQAISYMRDWLRRGRVFAPPAFSLTQSDVFPVGTSGHVTQCDHGPMRPRP